MEIALAIVLLLLLLLAIRVTHLDERQAHMQDELGWLQGRVAEMEVAIDLEDWSDEEEDDG